MESSSATHFDLEIVRRPLSERIRPSEQEIAADLAAAQTVSSAAQRPLRRYARILAAGALALFAVGLVMALARAGRFNLPRKRWS